MKKILNLNKIAFCGLLTLSVLSCKKDSTPAPTDPGTPAPTTPTTPTTPTYAAVGSVTYSRNGYSVVFTNKDPKFPEAERGFFVNTYFTVYPKMIDRFNPSGATSVTFLVDPAYTGIAETSGKVVTYNPQSFKDNPQGYDVVTHEVMHIVQAYPAGVPSWVTEGMADYARYKYGVNNAKGGWELPAYSSSQNYNDSYRVTARFFLWMELHVKATVLTQLNTMCRNGNYKAGIWMDLTGKSINELWDQYSKNPAL